MTSERVTCADEDEEITYLACRPIITGPPRITSLILPCAMCPMLVWVSVESIPIVILENALIVCDAHLKQGSLASAPVATHPFQGGIAPVAEVRAAQRMRSRYRRI